MIRFYTTTPGSGDSYQREQSFCLAEVKSVTALKVPGQGVRKLQQLKAGTDGDVAVPASVCCRSNVDLSGRRMLILEVFSVLVPFRDPRQQRKGEVTALFTDSTFVTTPFLKCFVNHTGDGEVASLSC